MRVNKKILIIGLIIIVAVGCYFYYQEENKKQAVVFLTVGQGDATLINLPGNNEILIDGGPDTSVLSGLARHMPIYDRSIELMILTHSHADHSAGLAEVLKRYQVKKIIWREENSKELAYQIFVDAAKVESGAELVLITSDMSFTWPTGKLNIFYPEDSLLKDLDNKNKENDLSLVVQWQEDDKKFLIMGDRGIEGEKTLSERVGEQIGNSEIIKIGHHGSEYSSSEEFLNLVKPKWAIISVGAQNKFGHPSLRVVRRLERLGAIVWRTDEMGDIVINK